MTRTPRVLETASSSGVAVLAGRPAELPVLMASSAALHRPTKYSSFTFFSTFFCQKPYLPVHTFFGLSDGVCSIVRCGGGCGGQLTSGKLTPLGTGCRSWAEIHQVQPVSTTKVHLASTARPLQPTKACLAWLTWLNLCGWIGIVVLVLLRSCIRSIRGRYVVLHALRCRVVWMCGCVSCASYVRFCG